MLIGKVPAAKFADKIVIIGATAAGVGVQFPVPGHPGLSPAETMAHITSSILGEHFIVQPTWGGVAGLGVLLLVIAYIVVALPRLSAGMAASATALFFFGLLAVEFGLLSSAEVYGLLRTWLR